MSDSYELLKSEIRSKAKRKRYLALRIRNAFTLFSYYLFFIFAVAIILRTMFFIQHKNEMKNVKSDQIFLIESVVGHSQLMRNGEVFETTNHALIECFDILYTFNESKLSFEIPLGNKILLSENAELEILSLKNNFLFKLKKGEIIIDNNNTNVIIEIQTANALISLGLGKSTIETTENKVWTFVKGDATVIPKTIFYFDPKITDRLNINLLETSLQNLYLELKGQNISIPKFYTISQEEAEILISKIKTNRIDSLALELLFIK